MAHSACTPACTILDSWTTARGKPAGGAAEVVRAAKFYMASQVETGHLCPITMTRASVAALAAQPDLLAKVMPVISTRAYDPTFAPWPTKRGMTLGMGMTEKQGGTDVRSNMTRAERDGDAYRITGHKWFMSARMCDAFLVLAQADEGLTCFFMPRFRPDGSINAIQFQRLKDKLGNRSNASSEVEFVGAHGVRVGDEGKGIRTIIQMVQLTRQDCAIASAGLAWIAIRPTRTPFARSPRAALDVMEPASRSALSRSPCWLRRLGMVSRALGLSHAGFHGRRAEIGAGGRCALASDRGLLRGGAAHRGVFCARLPLSRLGVVAPRAGRRHPAVVGGVDHATSAI